MQVQTASILASARAYVDDEHAAVASWIPDPTWMLWMNHEYRRAYRQSVMSGLIAPMYTDELLSAYDAAQTGYSLIGKPVAVVGVWEGTSVAQGRRLRAAQPAGGAIGAGSDRIGGSPVSWSALHSDATGIRLLLHPDPRPDTQRFICRYVPEPPLLVNAAPGAGEANSINIPMGLDDRIALGMARRALIKEGSSSAALERAIALAEQDLEFAAHSRIAGDPPRVRSSRKRLNADVSATDETSTEYPSNWVWF